MARLSEILSFLKKLMTTKVKKCNFDCEITYYILTIFTSDLISAVIISTEDLDFIKNHLEKFVKKVEAVYREVLMNWESDITIFRPVETLIEKIFQSK
ncbi:MAG: hypothetical protein ACTSR8_07015 [Promethearchaeota archaeon]